MRRHQPRRLDMLPLLDVFMVVLFVFATIQEDELETSKRDSARLQSDLERTAERESQTQHELQADLKDAQTRASQAESELEQRDAELATLTAALAELRAKADAVAKRADPGADDALRRQQVLAKVLDHFNVFEVEIAGSIQPDGSVLNRCCYRADLEASGWTSCGTIPAPATELADWLDDGAGGLIDRLRRTKGGNAMTLIRQDETATYRIAGSLEAALRDRITDHKLYNEGLALERILCPPDGAE